MSMQVVTTTVGEAKSMCNVAVTRSNCDNCWRETAVSSMTISFLGTWHAVRAMIGAAFRVRDLARDVDMQPRQSVGTPVVRRQACRRGLQHVIDLQVARMTNGFVVTVMATRMKLLL